MLQNSYPDQSTITAAKSYSFITPQSRSSKKSPKCKPHKQKLQNYLGTMRTKASLQNTKVVRYVYIGLL